jgi:membrane-associated phospholipid phosphatase
MKLLLGIDGQCPAASGRANWKTCCLAVIVLLIPVFAAAQGHVPDGAGTVAVAENSSEPLPDAPSSSAQGGSGSFGKTVGGIARTIGEDEWHLIKAPFKTNAFVWDALVVGATGVLIANDESVLYQVPVSWHQTSLNISDGATYGTAAIAGGVYFTGLITKNEHAQETGIRTAEATVDSVIMYGVMKAVFQRQRPYTGVGEGKFFSGNWTNGSFPSGHAMFSWTIASTVAHQYHSVPLDILMYGLASSVSVTRVTAGQHFPADVFVGSVLGYLVGDYVAHKPESGFPIRGQSKFKRVPNAILQHVTIGVE